MADNPWLPVDLGELCMALDDASAEHSWYLDLESGEVLFFASDMEDQAELEERLDASPDRYERVPAVESWEAYRDMEDFIETIRDSHLTELLEVAIAGSGAFRRFKDVLARFPEERERWFGFKNQRLKDRALEWLEEIGVALSDDSTGDERRA